ncbi:MAG: S8 family serine peptidase [Pseudomonadota bacterium]
MMATCERNFPSPEASRRRLPWAVLFLAAAFWLADAPGQVLPGGGPAFADDGDGDDGGDGDNGGNGGDNGGGGGGAGSGRGGEGGGLRSRGTRNRPGGLFNIFRLPQRNRNRRRARPAAALATRAPDELVVIGLTQAQTQGLEAQGYQVLDRQVVQALAAEVIRFRIRRGIGLTAARDEVQAVNAAASVDFNHYYRPGAGDAAATPVCSGKGCAAKNMIKWPVATGGQGTCGQGLRIGLIDTGINPDHKAFTQGRLKVLDRPVREARKSSARHGTAVAALLVGSAESRAPGLLPQAQLIAVDAFYRASRRDERSDAFTLVRSLDLLAREETGVINMSLSGPDNAALARMIGAMAGAGTVIVAAAGNRGPRAKPVFPAAYPSVIAVTAVDIRQRPYRRAGRGAHIDLAAPGVRVWTAASVRGARPKTGTSFAVPFVSAAVALAQHRLKLSGYDEVRSALADRAMDLGQPGKDHVFGHGLLQAGGLCGD